ncbi:MAG: hypothetical protein IJJ29_02275 [Solobacterium sp.]|nr:hypothetical protein [Solobacterium sp.]
MDIALTTPKLRNYIEQQIFPRYNSANGHGLDHIENVIRRSLDFAKRINDGNIKTSAEDFANLPASLSDGKINYDICYAVAAFHDLGRAKNNKLHHLVSSAWFLDDDFMEDFFTREELRVAADAIMDHRASNSLAPITIYGRIVSSADRDTDYLDILRRAYAYNRHTHPEYTDDEARQYCYDKIIQKFASPGAYGAKKMFFDNPEFDAMIAKFREICQDRTIFDAELDKALAK